MIGTWPMTKGIATKMLKASAPPMRTVSVLSTVLAQEATRPRPFVPRPLRRAKRENRPRSVFVLGHPEVIACGMAGSSSHSCEQILFAGVVDVFS